LAFLFLGGFILKNNTYDTGTAIFVYAYADLMSDEHA